MTGAPLTIPVVPTTPMVPAGDAPRFTYYDGRAYDVPPHLSRNDSGRETDGAYATRLLRAYEKATNGRERLAIRAALAHAVGLPPDFRPEPGRVAADAAALLRYQRVVGAEAARPASEAVQRRYAGIPNTALLPNHFVGADGRIYELGPGVRRARPDSDPLMTAFRTMQSMYERSDRGLDLRAYAAEVERRGTPSTERRAAQEKVADDDRALVSASLVAAMFGVGARNPFRATPPAPRLAGRNSGLPSTPDSHVRQGLPGLPWARPNTPRLVKGVQTYTHLGTEDLRAMIRDAERWLRPGFRRIDAGVYQSQDRLRQFRMRPTDLSGAHGHDGPHVHFEYLGQKLRINLHVPIPKA